MPQGTKLEDSVMTVPKANGSSRPDFTTNELPDDHSFGGFGDSLDDDLDEGFDDGFEEDFDEDFDEDFEEEFEDEWDKVTPEWTQPPPNPANVKRA